MRASAIVPSVKQEAAGHSGEPDEGGDEEDE
jgi:hypothetical protein